jgi:hypothetical protein
MGDDLHVLVIHFGEDPLGPAQRRESPEQQEAFHSGVEPQAVHELQCFVIV